MLRRREIRGGDAVELRTGVESFAAVDSPFSSKSTTA